MEIERKFLVKSLPEETNTIRPVPYEQGYLCTQPVVRIRKEGREYFLTYKTAGLMVREEYNLPLTEEAYNHLLPKIDHNLIHKTRYRIPYVQNEKRFVIELDVFQGELAPLMIAEVEFDTMEEAETFTPPVWFDREVTHESSYHNSNLCKVTYFDLK